MLWEGGRSKGTGVVQFATIEEAETAISACLPAPLLLWDAKLMCLDRCSQVPGVPVRRAPSQLGLQCALERLYRQQRSRCGFHADRWRRRGRHGWKRTSRQWGRVCAGWRLRKWRERQCAAGRRAGHGGCLRGRIARATCVLRKPAACGAMVKGCFSSVD